MIKQKKTPTNSTGETQINRVLLIIIILVFGAILIINVYNNKSWRVWEEGKVIKKSISYRNRGKYETPESLYYVIVDANGKTHRVDLAYRVWFHIEVGDYVRKGKGSRNLKVIDK